MGWLFQKRVNILPGTVRRTTVSIPSAPLSNNSVTSARSVEVMPPLFPRSNRMFSSIKAFAKAFLLAALISYAGFLVARWIYRQSSPYGIGALAFFWVAAGVTGLILATYK